ncbi:UDP-N-acetylmuramate dehydrogenase [Alcaligenes endophyticus]|uniref:UDP-N-acetylenolpyruvoylglucosamine reductase n=1 Tax=Alcaligenes endophyticus TaxID=1929088 RepID=A0ABT8EHA5_9BURK|nr:UDP-N-acetylmuramate dehydrogenase [Alcaligenes endophyticus]MCX5589684.1 UDP-N-acetylmuramate dehydrogenase [Alcaligenes endophyticus]MDN4120652.1 UDP-N-acetylmuramate dehydrogenase [Alcaligenes endophyticus]
MESLLSFDLSAHNTLGLHSVAEQVLLYQHRDELPTLQERLGCRANFFVLGGGSNVVLNSTLRQPVVHVLSKGIRLLESDTNAWLVEAEAGENWHEFVQYCLTQGWPGLENLALIPGTVGAAPVQNIGAYGLELEQRVHSVLAWHFPSGSLKELSAAECGFAYRDSRFKRDPAGTWLIVAVRFLLAHDWQPMLHYADLQQRVTPSATPQAVFDAVCDIRRSKLPDPAVLGNAGSFFKNPVVSRAKRDALLAQWPAMVSYDIDDQRCKLAAAWLIDQLGWKGRRMGAVGVHRAQALVLVNYGGGRAQDIRRLASTICTEVRSTYGVELEQEPINVD